MNSGFTTKTDELQIIEKWLAGIGEMNRSTAGIASWTQGWGKLHMSKSIIDEPLCLAGKIYAWGFGTHADSEIVLCSRKPIKTFRSRVGHDDNRDSGGSSARMVFSVLAGDKTVVASGPLGVKSQPEFLEAELGGISEITLRVKTLNTIRLAHADWAEAEIITTDGEHLKLGSVEMQTYVNILPLSFRYNDMDSEVWFRKWGVTRTRAEKKGFTLHRFVTADRDTGLELTLELEQYHDLPAVLWNVYFHNAGSKPTPILEQVKVLDLTRTIDENMMLYRGRGAFHYEEGKITGESFRDNFLLETDNLLRIPNVSMSGVGGRSSVDWMPYFNFAGTDEGLMFGIGWTGQWQAEITAGNAGVRFRAGMEFIHTRLEPGERIRQPAILMLAWKGNDPIRGHNLLRRFIQDKLLPKDSAGKTLQLPVSEGHWGGMIAEHHLDRLRNSMEHNLPYDYYWIDAGWYGKAGPNRDEFTSEWALQAGDWSINRDTYPHGFKEISDVAHAAKRKFLLWVEPERAIFGVPNTLEHPDWYLGIKEKGSTVLLNLGNPEARQWCTELIAGLIKEQGLDCYRQDFNMSPLPFWQGNDTPDRIGMTEIRYIEGLYAFLGELRRRYPDLMIDNCASGGRRLDFEMMRYSIPFWGSDMQCFLDYVGERNLQLVHGLSYWLPQFGFGTQERPGDTYHFRSTLAAGLIAHLFTYEYCPIRPDYPYDWLRERLNEYHRAKVFFSGDFYPLCEQTGSFKSWTANQFHRPDLNAGILEVFRKSESDIEKMRLRMHGLENAEYELENADSGEKTVLSGRKLMEDGLSVEIPQRRDCRWFFYHRK